MALHYESRTCGCCSLALGIRCMCPHQVAALLTRITSWPPSLKHDIISKIELDHSICIYFMNIPAKFHPNPIWNDRALGLSFFENIALTRRRGRTRLVAIWEISSWSNNQLQINADIQLKLSNKCKHEKSLRVKTILHNVQHTERTEFSKQKKLHT